MRSRREAALRIAVFIALACSSVAGAMESTFSAPVAFCRPVFGRYTFFASFSEM